MRTIAAIATALVTVSLAVPAVAQMSENTRQQLAFMQARDTTTYAHCRALAIQRGYSDVDQENEGAALMNFINGCMMGQQR